MRVLEVGCGTGANIRMLSEEGFGDLWGLDVSPNACHATHESFGSSVTTVCDDVRDFVRRDHGQFDLIIDVCALECVGDTTMPEQLRQHLAPMGKLFSIWVQSGCDTTPISKLNVRALTTTRQQVDEMYAQYSSVTVGWEHRSLPGGTYIGHWVVEATR